MSGAALSMRSLCFERHVKHSPEKVWRALTEAALIEQWLMSNDFIPEVGHRFTVRGRPLPGWSGVTQCEVLAVEPPRLLAYRWGNGTESEAGLITLVTWTLTPTRDGTLIVMEQSGFRPGDELAYHRIGVRWPRFLERLEQTCGGLR